MFEPLRRLADAYSFVTLDRTCEIAELAELLREHTDDGMVRIVAHSWGVVRLLAALQRLPGVTAIGVLAAPVPTTWTAFDAVRSRLFAGFSPDTLSWLADPHTGKLSDHQVQTILPHYVSANACSRPTNLTFDLQTYRDELSQMGGYDVRASLAQVHRCTAVTGEDDFVPTWAIADLLAACRSHLSVANAGHFVLHEQWASSEASIVAALSPGLA